MRTGVFIVFEGLDGAGTTTQAELMKRWLDEAGAGPVYLTREPTNGPVGSLIRSALRRQLVLDAHTFALLFAADRMEHLASDLREKLDRGVTVICDRYYLSSFAYQWLDLKTELEWLEQLNARAIPPDLTILLDVPAEVCIERIRRARSRVELFEEVDRLRGVRENYLAIAHGPRSQRERIVVVDGNRLAEAVHAEVRAVVQAEWGEAFVKAHQA
ncbi:MAG: dTMP kinase [Candidatus Latescibacteria bacterium]|nr:dTMP kinase [Candidatus Latescibacterota bacterium]